MRPGTPGFVGARLKEAREARGLTQISLGEILGVSNRAVSQYEKGEVSPAPEMLAKLPNVLNVPMGFLFDPITEEEEGFFFFRSMSSATASARKRAERKYGWLKRIVDYQEKFVVFPKVNFPPCEFSEDIEEITDGDIETAASKLRRFWGLGDGPISNMAYLLENNGAIVTRIDLAADTLDAFSVWRRSTQRPYCILGSAKASAARSRFDAAHELAHMILHRNAKEDILRSGPKFKLMETQAHNFAGAFLLPAEMFSYEFLVPTIKALIYLKARWNVSISAMIMRAKRLGLITERQERRLWINYAKRGYKKEEPFDNEALPEKPELLKQAFSRLMEGGFQSRSQITDALPLSSSDVHEFIGMPQSFLNEAPKVRVLHPRETPAPPTGQRPPAGSEESKVIPLRKTQ